MPATSTRFPLAITALSHEGLLAEGPLSETMTMKILLASDGSDTARASLDYLLAFPLPASTEITVLSVIREVMPPDDVARLSERHRQAFEQTRAKAEIEA